MGILSAYINLSDRVWYVKMANRNRINTSITVGKHQKENVEKYFDGSFTTMFDGLFPENPNTRLKRLIELFNHKFDDLLLTAEMIVDLGRLIDKHEMIEDYEKLISKIQEYDRKKDMDES